MATNQTPYIHARIAIAKLAILEKRYEIAVLVAETVADEPTQAIMMSRYGEIVKLRQSCEIAVAASPLDGTELSNVIARCDEYISLGWNVAEMVEGIAPGFGAAAQPESEESDGQT